jgi:hypothetical protein
MNSNETPDYSKHEKIKKEIDDTIEKMKKRDEKVWPEKKYMELVSKEGLPGKLKKKEEEQKDNTTRIAILNTAICLILLTIAFMMFRHVVLKTGGQLTRQPVQPTITEEGYQAIHNIEFKIENCFVENNALYIELKVSNKSENNFYTTVRSMYLVDKDGKEYLPNVEKGNIPTNFYGRRIEPQTEVYATIAYDGITEIDNKLTLVINNVSDSYHFIWDYMITLPEN